MHYLYQVIGARRLSAVEYGELNAWMAYLSLCLAAGTVLQFVSNFKVLTDRGFRTLATLSSAAAVLVGVLILSGVIPVTPLVAGITTIALSLPFYTLIGQFQARQAFVAMGFGLFVLALTKLSLLFLPVMATAEQFYAAFPLATGMATVVLGIFTLTTVGRAAAEKKRPSDLRTALPGSVVLAVAMALLPQLDILNLTRLCDAEELGRFARVSLFSKAVFFGAITLLQISLPFHVAATSPEARRLDGFRRVVLLERTGLAACVFGSVVLAWISPIISLRFLGFDLSGMQSWVLLSCLSLTALYGHLQRLQTRVARGEWRQAAAGLAAVGAITPIAWIAAPASVPVYLQLALASYLAVEVVERVLDRLKSRSGSIARTSAS